jgi:hypothetical protein
MIQAILPFLSAIMLSAIAGYYSVIGLALIFTGSFWPVIIMGASLECAKLVTVSWLYNNWKDASLILRCYFLTAVFFLMLITSMGIFGYLSKAHLESTQAASANSVPLQNLQAQEKMVRDRLDYLMKRAGDPETATNRIDKQIQETQAELKKITTEMLPLMKEQNTLMADVGPIRYIAELIYDKSDTSFIDKAVRSVIFIIIFVFDPLAVLLLIASNQTWQKLKEEKPVEEQPTKKTKTKVKLDKAPSPSIESFFKDSVSVPKSNVTKIDGEFK